MSKNDENQPLLDKDDARAEGENAGGKFLCIFLVLQHFYRFFLTRIQLLLQISHTHIYIYIIFAIENSYSISEN